MLDLTILGVPMIFYFFYEIWMYYLSIGSDESFVVMFLFGFSSGIILLPIQNLRLYCNLQN